LPLHVLPMHVGSVAVSIIITRPMKEGSALSSACLPNQPASARPPSPAPFASNFATLPCPALHPEHRVQDLCGRLALMSSTEPPYLKAQRHTTTTSTNQSHHPVDEPVAMHPLPPAQQVQDLCGRLNVVSGTDGLSLEAQRNATIMSMSLLRANLASKRVLRVGAGVGKGQGKGKGDHVHVAAARQPGKQARAQGGCGSIDMEVGAEALHFKLMDWLECPVPCCVVTARQQETQSRLAHV